MSKEKSQLTNMDEQIAELEIDQLKVKLFQLSDDSLKELGELLTNVTSRSIIMTLAQDEMYLNQLASKLDMRVSLAVHHLKKLANIGLLDIVDKPISRKTKNHRHFKINTDIFLSLTKQDSSKFQKIFKDGIKFAGISIAGIFSYFGVFNVSQKQYLPYGVESNFPDPIIVALIVIIFGLLIERLSLYFRKRK